MRAQELSLAVSREASFAAWHGGLDDGSSIYIQKVDEKARLVGRAFRISDGKRLAYEPDLIFAGDRLIVAWYEKNPETRQLTAQMASVSPDGNIVWVAQLGDRTRTARNPVVRVVGNEVHVAWIEQPWGKATDNHADVWHQSFSLDGKAETPATKVGDANRDTWNLNAAVSSGAFLVTYDAALRTKAHELQMIALRGLQVQHIRLSPDDGKASLYPDLQVNGAGEAALTWFDEKDGNREIYCWSRPWTHSEPAMRNRPYASRETKGNPSAPMRLGMARRSVLHGAMIMVVAGNSSRSHSTHRAVRLALPGSSERARAALRSRPFGRAARGFCWPGTTMSPPMAKDMRL